MIPLVHAPDDPGPDAASEVEPQSEPSNGGWRKILNKERLILLYVAEFQFRYNSRRIRTSPERQLKDAE